MAGDQQNGDRWRRYWDKTSASYDKQMRFYDRLLADSRRWVCAQATGDTLRRPLRQVQAAGLQVQRRERFKLGIIERLTARKPAHR